MILQALLDLLQAEESEPDVERLIERLLQTVHTTTSAAAVTLCLLDSVRDDLHCFSLTQEPAVDDVGELDALNTTHPTVHTNHHQPHSQTHHTQYTHLSHHASQLSQTHLNLPTHNGPMSPSFGSPRRHSIGQHPQILATPNSRINTFSNTVGSLQIDPLSIVQSGIYDTEWVFRQGSISDTNLVAAASQQSDMLNINLHVEHIEDQPATQFLVDSFQALVPLLGDDVVVESCLFMPILHSNGTTMALLYALNKQLAPIGSTSESMHGNADSNGFNIDDEQLFHTLSAQIGSILRRRLTQVLLERSRTVQSTNAPVQALLQIYGSNPMPNNAAVEELPQSFDNNIQISVDDDHVAAQQAIDSARAMMSDMHLQSHTSQEEWQIAQYAQHSQNVSTDPLEHTDTVEHDFDLHPTNRFRSASGVHGRAPGPTATGLTSSAPIPKGNQLTTGLPYLPVIGHGGSVNVTRRPSLLAAQPQHTPNALPMDDGATVTIEVDGEKIQIASGLLVNGGAVRARNGRPTQQVLERLPAIKINNQHVPQKVVSPGGSPSQLHKHLSDSALSTPIKKSGSHSNLQSHKSKSPLPTSPRSSNDVEMALLLAYQPTVASKPWALANLREQGIRRSLEARQGSSGDSQADSDDSNSDYCNPIWPAVVHSRLPATADLLSLSFNCWDYSAEELLPICVVMLRDIGVIAEYALNMTTLQNFLLSVRDNYRDNPYHNFYHGFSVMQFTYLTLRTTRAANFLPIIDQLSLMIASLCHDIDHTGTNNLFHVNAGTAIARAHNDQAVLENHHAFVTFELLRLPGLNLLDNRSSRLTTQQCKQIRRTIILSILATDMAHHFEMCHKLDKLEPECQSLNSAVESDRQLLMNVIVHAADISAQCLPTPIATVWEQRVTAEFMNQATLERKLQLPVAPFMTDLHDTRIRYNNHISFLDYIMTPLWKGVVNLLPPLQPCLDHLTTNRKYFQALIPPATTEKTDANKEASASAEKKETPAGGSASDSVRRRSGTAGINMPTGLRSPGPANLSVNTNAVQTSSGGGLTSPSSTYRRRASIANKDMNPLNLSTKFTTNPSTPLGSMREREPHSGKENNVDYKEAPMMLSPAGSRRITPHLSAGST